MNALPILLLGGAALLMMGGKKNGKKTNGTKTNGTNGTKTDDKTSTNGYADEVYAALNKQVHSANISPGDKILIMLPEHPFGSGGVWDAHYEEENVALAKKSAREHVLTALKKAPGTGYESIRFDAINPNTNDVMGDAKVLMFWKVGV